jgi:hypothetical protein
MGLLQYANLGLTTDFQRAQRDVFNGLGDLYRHLRTLEHHLVRDEAILRIGWSRADAPDWARPRKGDQAKAPPGVWIKLDDTGAHGGAEQIEATMAAFLDEGARDVHERSPSPDDEDDDRDDATTATATSPATSPRASGRASPGSPSTASPSATATPAPACCSSIACRATTTAAPSSPSDPTPTSSASRSAPSSTSRTRLPKASAP